MAIPPSTKKRVLLIAGNKCVACTNIHNEVHHLDGNKRNNEPRNLAPLCKDHHIDAHAQLAFIVMKEEAKNIEKISNRYKRATEQKFKKSASRLKSISEKAKKLYNGLNIKNIKYCRKERARSFLAEYFTGVEITDSASDAIAESSYGLKAGRRKLNDKEREEIVRICAEWKQDG